MQQDCFFPRQTLGCTKAAQLRPLAALFTCISSRLKGVKGASGEVLSACSPLLGWKEHQEGPALNVSLKRRLKGLASSFLHLNFLGFENSCSLYKHGAGAVGENILGFKLEDGFLSGVWVSDP